MILYATRFKKTTNQNNVIKYEQVLDIEYQAGADGENVIVLTALIGMRIVQIEREIKPLYAADFSFNSYNGQINLLNGVQLSAGETLFIIYAKIVIE